MIVETSNDSDNVEFDAFLSALKQTDLDAEAGSKAYHHSAVDPAEWQTIIDRLQNGTDQNKS